MIALHLDRQDLLGVRELFCNVSVRSGLALWTELTTVGFERLGVLGVVLPDGQENWIRYLRPMSIGGKIIKGRVILGVPR